jgi:hypothetical protein
MDGTLTYHRNSERRFLPRPVSGIPLLFTLAECCAEEDQIQVGNATEYAKLIAQSAGSNFVRLKKVKFTSGFDDNMPYLNNTVDYAEQL